MKVAAVKKPGGLGNLVIEDRPDPKPKAGEVLVRVRASSLNYHDFIVALGGIPTPDGRIPMSDGAGEVVAVGEGVTKWKTGDRVISLFFPNWQSGQVEAAGFASVPGDGADGFGCELYAGPETAFTRMPKGWTFDEAATLPCAALTAWRGMYVETRTKPGDWVLVQGTGGVSIFALQFAKATGARVIATSSSHAKKEKLRRRAEEERRRAEEDREDEEKETLRMAEDARWQSQAPSRCLHNSTVPVSPCCHHRSHHHRRHHHDLSHRRSAATSADRCVSLCHRRRSSKRMRAADAVCGEDQAVGERPAAEREGAAARARQGERQGRPPADGDAGPRRSGGSAEGRKGGESQIGGGAGEGAAGQDQEDEAGEGEDGTAQG